MSLMEKIKRQKAEFEAKQEKKNGGTRLPFWRPGAKRSTIRIMPPWATEGIFAEQFWRKAAQHWGVKDGMEGPVLCPKHTEGFEDGESCPICDFVTKLRADKSNIAAQSLAKDIRAKETYFMAVIDLKDPKYTDKDAIANESVKVGDPKIQIYACPPTVFNSIITVMESNEVDITSLTDGYDIFLEKSQASGKNSEYVKYTVTPAMKSTKAPVPEGFTTPALDSVGWKMSHKELSTLLSDGKGGDHLALTKGSSTEDSDDDGGYLAGGSDDDGDDLKKQMESELGVSMSEED